MEYWHFPVIARIIIASVIFQILLKSTLGKHLGATSFHKKFFTQYCFCVSIATLIALMHGGITVDWMVLGIIALGFANGFGAYSQWKATQINQSKNSIFTIFDDFIAMALSYWILSEGQYLNTGNVTGLALCISAVFFLFLIDLKRKGEHATLAFYGYVAFYSIIWGLAIFLQKYFGFRGIPIEKFLLCWYVGAFTASIVIFLILQKKETNRLEKKDYLTMFLLSSCVIGSVALQYESYKHAPQVIVQPIFLVLDMILPALIGLYIFKERKEFTLYEKILFIVAFSGGIVVAINY